MAVTDRPILFRLPYPLDASLIYSGASQGRWQQQFELRRDVELAANRNSVILQDRAGRVRSDQDRSFGAMGGGLQLFSFHSVLAKSAEAGRHQVVTFLAFWALQHLWSALHYVHTCTIVYNPKANPVECAQREINTKFCILLDKQPMNRWSQELDKALLSYRITPN